MKERLKENVRGESDQQISLGRPKCLWFAWVSPNKVNAAATDNMGDCTATATLGR